MFKRVLFIGLAVLLYSLPSHAQIGGCDPSVPVYYLDLSGAPDSIWTMPNVMRDGSCCGYNHPPNSCVKFIVTLDPASQGITFNVTDGALPNNLEWQLMNSAQDACDPTTYQAGEPVCLDGVGPHVIVFCKPGGNNNTYTITSIQAPSISGDLILNDGCSDVIQAVGFDVPTIEYNSVYPGIFGAYNNILSCASACSIVTITGQQGYPPYVDFQVCGMPIGSCFATEVCDTVRVYFNPALTATINPLNPIICYGSNTTTVTALGSGGFPPYSYLWSTGDTAQSITIGVGTYSVTVNDASNCPVTANFVNVTYSTSPITANAGADQVVCTNNLPVQLTGTISGATGGLWFGGSGLISPSPTSLNITYTPSATEITNGGFALNLVTTGNGNCPADTDLILVTIFVFQAGLTDSADVTCNGAADGSATASANSANLPITYQWSNGIISAVNNGLSGGSYTVTVTDNAGCTDIMPVLIYEPPPITGTITSTTTPCNFSLATAQVFPSGGNPGYSFQWNDTAFQTTQLASNLGAGFYNVTVTDISGCTKVFGVAVNNSGPPYIDITDSVMVSCFGGNNGSATSVITTAGNPPHTFLWNDPLAQTTPIANGLPAGTYIVIVTDATNCIGSAQVTITQPTVITSVTQSQNISCFGQADGTASVTANGGTPPYSFIWSNGQGFASITGLAQGTHYVTITDLNNCQHIDSVFINEPSALTSTVGNLTNITCNGLTNGSVTIIGNNGTPPYSFAWSTGQSSQSLSNLTSGVYTVTVSDNSGCTVVSNITISQPAVLTITGNTVDVPCYGNITGSVDITVSGGTSPYLYGWSNGFVTEDLYFIGAGNYSVTINDANGCSSSQVFAVTQPNALTIYSGVSHISCFGAGDGSINIFVSGGTPVYTYLWNTGSINDNISGLLQGTYQLTVTDANLCTATLVKVINEPPVFNAVVTIPLSYNGFGVPCYGDTIGFINLSATGGVTPYTYSWSNSTNNIDLYNVGAGSYSVTVTDAHNCTAVADTEITQPPQFIVSVALTDVLCYNGLTGSADVTVSGGVPLYSIIWSTTDTTTDLLNISAGSYWVQVQDLNNCTFFDSLMINQPNELILSCTPDTIICKNTQAIINASCTGGVLPYDYFWNNNPGLSVFTVTPPGDTIMNVFVRDDNNCISNIVTSTVFTYPGVNLSVSTTDDSVCVGESTQIIAIISGGYSNNYTLSDMNQTITSPYIITPNATQDWIFMAKDSCNVKAWDTLMIYALPVPVISAVFVTDVLCYGKSTGSIDITVTGGTPAYNFLWNPIANTEDLLNVPAGSYHLQVIDTNNCYVIDSMNIAQPTELVITCSADTLICKNSLAIINADATGGIPPYIYYWNQSPGIDNLTIAPQADTTFLIYVKDANNCVSDSVYSSINTVPSVQLSVNALTDSVCMGNSTQIIASNFGSYTGPYALYYNNLPVTSPYFVTPVSTHDWIFMAEDTCNIQSYDTVLITVLPVPSITNTIVTDVLCYGQFTGAIDVSVTGGTPGYTYIWNSTATTEDLQNVQAGTYYFQIKDVNNCSVADTIVITQPPQLLISCSSDTLICKNSPVTLAASATGGSGAYSYYWNGNPGLSMFSITPALDTTILVYIRDGNNCNSDTLYSTISIVPTIKIVLSTPNDSICVGNSTQIIANSVGSYTGAYTLYYNNQPVTSPYIISPNTTHDWIFMAQDSCNIQSSDTIIIYALPVPVISGINITDVVCYGNQTGAIDLTVTGGTPGYIYLWSSTAVTEDLTNIAAGNYYIQIQDLNNCFIIDTFTVAEPSEIIVTCPTDTLVCKYSTVNLSASVTGGVPPYTFYWNNAPGVGNYSIIAQSDTLLNIYVEDASNCFSDTVITTIHVSPSIQLFVTVSDDSVCIGSSAQITANIYGAYSGPYSLYYNNQQINSPYTITPNSTQNLIFMAQDSCNIASFDTITIYALQNPMITDVNVTNVLCYGETTGAIDISVSGGITPYQYLWSATSTTEDLINVQAGIYFVLVRDVNNCSVSDTMVIYEPNELLISSSFDTLTCKNSNTVLQASASGGVTPYTYFWNGNMGMSQHTVIPATDTIIYIFVRDANNCITDSVSTHISIYPNVTISVFAVDDTVCSGTHTQIFANVSGGAGAPYSIFNENMQSINIPYEIAPINSQFWVITGMDSCHTSAQDSVFIQTISVPTISISADVFSGCIPLLVKFSATAEPEPQSYLWNFGENNAFSFSKDPEFLYTQEGSYDISLNVITTEGCSSNLQYSDMITVHPKPESRFNYDPISPNIFNPLVTFTNYSTAGANSYWSFGDGDSSQLTDPIHQYSTPGTFDISLMVQNVQGCKNISYAQITVKDEYTFYAPSAFSPDFNDINDNFSVYGYGIDSKRFTLYIYDRWGEIIFQTSKLVPGEDGGMYSEPWNGQVNNNSPISQIDTYTWLVIYNDIKGAYRKKAGSVVIIR